MKVVVVGAGVIGTIYGHLFAEAGHQVTHLVRPSSASRLAEGCTLELLDARGGTCRETVSVYRPELTDRLDAAMDFDLVLVSVKHYQLDDLLPTLAAGPRSGQVLIFNNWWSTFDLVDAGLPVPHLWGFPVAGGGFDRNRLVGAVLDHVVLDETAGAGTQAQALFHSCGVEIETQPDMLGWLWTHFAIEAGVVAAAMKSGSVDAFLGDTQRIVEAVLAVRDALAVVAARGLDLSAFPDAQMFMAPETSVAQAIHDQYQVDRAARRIMERHTGGAELGRIYHDVIGTGRELGVRMPVLESLGDDVDRYIASSAELA